MTIGFHSDSIFQIKGFSVSEIHRTFYKVHPATIDSKNLLEHNPIAIVYLYSPPFSPFPSHQGALPFEIPSLKPHRLISITPAMADDNAVTLYSNAAITDTKKNPLSVKVALTQMLRGGAVVEVTTLDQAKIAESAGACCVVVSDPRVAGISRMADPSVIKEVKQALSIPVMAKARVGHFVEAQILESIGVDYIDESEALAVADEDHFINKHNFRATFVCGCRDLGEALRRVREGAALIRSQGDLNGSGNIAETVRSVRRVMGEIRVLSNMDEDEVFTFSKGIQAPYDIVAQTKQMGRLPVVHFAAGGIATPADAALLMQLGCDGVFLGPEVFDCPDPYKRVRAIVQAVRNYNDPLGLAQASSGLEDSLAGLNLGENRGAY
ncbi:Pyridoxal 5-phosphate synthase-like subunit PDX1.2 [Striga hermonthica]|uniref:Pyridoxal 5-phosphate synthase-like subunit PDX1.2 n=1 Tax=Striga hermonthica TaxID=68872 RepID=A0A9N7RKM4_STRHE|nr:Pyridoxal 5-phosphate synthase-like subunit PDX1.2 [Striga hermonthica]